MSKEDIIQLKEQYNYNLKRMNNGCRYCETHKNEVDKWLPELFKIYDNMNNALEEIIKYEKVESRDIREGFII